jgi:hypothetical protein
MSVIDYGSDVVGAATPEDALETFRATWNPRLRAETEQERAQGLAPAEPSGGRTEQVRYQRVDRSSREVLFVGRDGAGRVQVLLGVSDSGTNGPRWLVGSVLVCDEYRRRGGEL